MRSKSIFNENKQRFWNCAKEVVVYNYQGLKITNLHK